MPFRLLRTIWIARLDVSHTRALSLPFAGQVLTVPALPGPGRMSPQITASSWRNNRADLVFVVEPGGVLFVPLPKPFIKFLKRGNDGTEAEALRRL